MSKLTEIGCILREFIEELAQKKVDEGASSEKIVSLAIAFPVYKQERVHKKDTVETDPETRQPFKCLIEYDGSVHPDWNLLTPTLWMPYHGTDIAHAYPFIKPTGAHDMYKTGEMAKFEDGTIQRAKQDTVYSPEEFPNAWEVVTEEE